MSRMDSETLREIESLMEERRKYESWIISLGERRSTTPGHVFQRVLADYQERMRQASAGLAGRAAEVEASVTDLRSRLSALQEEETRTSDERSEAELRAAVGEYTPDRWEEVRRIADENIARLSSERMKLGEELEHLVSILAVAGQSASSLPGGDAGTRGGGAGHGAPGSAPEQRQPTPPMTRSQTPATPQPVATANKPAAQENGRDAKFDELAFLTSVVETEISHLPAQNADLRESKMTGGLRDIIVEPDSALEPPFKAEPTPASSRIVRSATPLITESLRSAPDGSDVHARMSEESPRAMFERKLSGSVPAYLKDVGKEATKTLKCQECGTMNFPTEWYCERCGGELAAL
jgi:hypothetical protein